MRAHKNYRKFIEDVGLIGIANIMNNCKSLLIIPLLTKHLGAYNYGIWTQVKTTLIFLIPFFTFGTGQAIVKFLAGENDRNRIRDDYLSCLFAALAASSLAAFFCFSFSDIFSVWIFGNNEFKALTRIFAVLLVFESGNALLLEYLKTFRLMKIYFKTLLAETIFELSIIAYSIFKEYGIIGAVVSLLISRLVFVIIRTIRIGASIGFAFPKFVNLRKYVSFGIPFVFSSFFFFMLNWGNRYFINYFLGLKHVGLYSVAYFLSYTITIIAAPIGYILLPTISSCVRKSEKEEAIIYLKYSLKYFFMAGIPLIFGICFLSKEILVMFSTPDFLGVREYLPALTIGIFIFQLGVIGEYVNMVFGKNTLILAVYGVLMVFNTVLNMALIPATGAKGAALAMFLSYVCYGLFNLTYSQRFLRFAIPVRDFFKILASAIIMILALYAFKKTFSGVNAIFFSPFCIILYFVMLRLTKLFTDNEFALFMSVLSRKNTSYEKV